MNRLQGLGVNAVKAEADRHAATVRPIIENIQGRGAKSLRAIAAELTRMRVPTAVAAPNGPRSRSATF
jgi:histidinol dehydrogenase